MDESVRIPKLFFRPRQTMTRACAWPGLLLALSLAAGCRPAPAPPAWPGLDPNVLDGQSALAETEKFIALGPRISGTDGAEKAAAYLYQRLRALEIDAELDVFSDPAPGGPTTFRNVLGRIPGAGSNWVVIASHYDTKSGVSPDFTGANDSGSSTGLLLELGRQLRLERQLPTYPDLPASVLLAFLDGEECRERYGPHDGLHGSRRLARLLREDGRAGNTLAVIVLDMIGDRNLSVTMPRNVTPALGMLALRAAEEEGVRHLFKLWPQAILDDHQSFLDAGIPAVLLIDFEYGAAPGRNEHWHTPADTMDKLSPDSLRTVGRVTLRMLNEIFSGRHHERQ